MELDKLCRILEAQYYSPAVDAEYRRQGDVILTAWERLNIANQQGIILADQVGLGKTFEALSLAMYTLIARRESSRPRVLVVVPSWTLAGKWLDEFDRFVGILDATHVESFMGTRERKDLEELKRIFRDPFKRLRLYSGSIRIDDQRVSPDALDNIYLTTFDALLSFYPEDEAEPNRIESAVFRRDWNMVIIDEAHHLRGSGVKAQTLRYLLKRTGARTRIVLCTATPFQLDTTELVELVRALCSDTRSLERVENGIKNYNSAIHSIKLHIEAFQRQGLALEGNAGLEDRLQKASQAKKKLETVLRPYIVRVPREQENRVQAKDPPIDTPDDFRWLYLAVRRWMTDVAILQSEKGGKPPFVSTALSMTTSSFSAIQRHIRQHTPPRARTRHFDLATNLLGKGQISQHPKQAHVENLIREQLKEIDVGKLAQQKFVIFVKWQDTVDSLRSSRGQSQVMADAIESRIRTAMNSGLQILGMGEKPFLSAYHKALRAKAEDLMASFPFAVDGKNVWTEPYQPRMQFRWYEKFSKEDDATEEEQEGGRSLHDVFLANIRLKFSELLHRLEVVQALAPENGSSIEAQIKIQVDERLRRVQNHLYRMNRDYFDAKQVPVQPRRWLLFKLSQLVYNLSPRKVVEALEGDVDYATRLQIIDAFNFDLYPLILVSSKVGQEGIDLQKRCDNVIHLATGHF